MRGVAVLLIISVLAGCADVDEDRASNDPPGPAADVTLFLRQVEVDGRLVEVLSLEKDTRDIIGGGTPCSSGLQVHACGMGPFHWVNGSASVPAGAEATVHLVFVSTHPGPVQITAIVTADGVRAGAGTVDLTYLGTFYPSFAVAVDIPVRVSGGVAPSQHLAVQIEYDGTLGATQVGSGEYSPWIHFANATVHHAGDF